MSNVATSKSTPGLLKAMQGFIDEHGSSPQHKPIAEQLAKMKSEIDGTQGGKTSPGKDAVEKAIKHGMPAETGHDGGDGNIKSQDPGEAHPPDKLADIAGPSGSKDDRLTGVAAVPSGGNVHSQHPSSGLAPGTLEMRRIVADREGSRPDSRMKVDPKPGEDNKQSQPAGPPAPPASRIGDVKTPPATDTGRQAEAERAARDSGDQPEEPPVRTTQQNDPFAAAKQKARKMLAAANS